MDVIDQFYEAILAGLAGRGRSLLGLAGGSAAASALHSILFEFINFA